MPYPREPMKVVFRGLTVELGAGDPRVQSIAVMLFGEVDPPPPAPPPPAVPAPIRAYWKRLTAMQKRLLVLLLERVYPRAELAAALNVDGFRLSKASSGMTRLGMRMGVPRMFRIRGSKETRRYELEKGPAESIRVLAAEDAARAS